VELDAATSAAFDGFESRPRVNLWARSELMIRYHDEESGVPVHGDRTLFEFLIINCAIFRRS
jgi:3-methyladenine DNA glycosylase Tag